MASTRAAGRIVTMIVSVAALLAFVAPSALAAAPVTTPDGLWTWVRPLPFGYPANAIAAPAPGTLFVATGATDALVTRDGGAGWSWSPTNLPTGFEAGATGITFVSPTEGWAGGRGLILHTVDGGLSWETQLTMAASSPFSQPTFTQLSFSDASSGWAVSPMAEITLVYATKDGGQTWTDTQAPWDDYSSFRTLAPQGPGRAVLIKEVWSTGLGNGDPVGTRLWWTTDYGAHWSAPTTLNHIYLRGAVFFSADRGVAIGSSWLWSTSDGGASWQKLRRTPSAYPQSISSLGNDVWVADSGSLLHSADAGRSWQSLHRTGFVSMIAFSTPLDGWAAGGEDARYLHTTDGGKSWHALTSAPKSPIGDLQTVSGGTLWGTAGFVVKSSDAGRRWSRLTTRSDLTAVAAISARRAWAVGPKGLIIRTTDGGRHWSRQASGVTVDLADVFFLDAKHGWVTGAKGNILRTVDGGRHWARNHSAVGGGRTVTFSDAKHGVVVPGFRPFILTTVNGGRTWSVTRFSPLNYQALAVSMKDASHWLLISGGVASWVTSDGGKSWQQAGDLPGTSQDFASIVRSGSRLCAIGWDGTVSTTTDDGASWTYAGSPPVGYGTCGAFADSRTLLVSGSTGMVARDLIAAPLP